MRPSCLLLLTLLAGAAQAQGEAPARGIYTCTTPDGRKLTGDRPIPDCASREQRILNADGSVRGTLPPFMSPEERAAKEAADRKAHQEKLAQQDAVRRDRLLMQRFPTEAAHQKVRAAALDDVHKAMKTSQQRIVELENERKPLNDEAEFYTGKALPAKVRQALDANDAAVDAQKTLIENLKAEKVRINANYDAELARLRKLWAGAAPGTLPPLEARPPSR